MQIANKTDLIEIREWLVRIKKPENRSSDKVLLILHGWSGDENSMWVFTKDIPQDYWVISPRAPYSAGSKGFSWRNSVERSTWGAPSFADFQNSLKGLPQMISEFEKSNEIICKTIDLIGFSQGAALVCALLLSEKLNVEKAACLAGFMPEGWEKKAGPGKLLGKKVFVSHGISDELISIDRGKKMVEILKYAGAEVELCAEDGGHKVGLQCYKGLKKFFSL